MRWLCWILPHKWIGAFDPQYEQCEHCPKIRPKPKTLPKLPCGTMHCPYPECQDWCSPPSSHKTENGTVFVKWDTTCAHCKQPIRWTRKKDKWGSYTDEWHEPWAIVEGQP